MSAPAPARSTSPPPRRLAIHEIWLRVTTTLTDLAPSTIAGIASELLETGHLSLRDPGSDSLHLVCRFVFEDAIAAASVDDAAALRLPLYAKLCAALVDNVHPDVTDGKTVNAQGELLKGAALVRRYVRKRAQAEFEMRWGGEGLREKYAARGETGVGGYAGTRGGGAGGAGGGKAASSAAASAAGRGRGGEGGSSGAGAASSNRPQEEAKRATLATLLFVAELYKAGILVDTTMHTCLKSLLAFVGVPEDETVEALVTFLYAVGPSMEASADGRRRVAVYFDRLRGLLREPVLAVRLKLMLAGLLELRKAKWQLYDLC